MKSQIYKEMNISIIKFSEPDYPFQCIGLNGFYNVLCVPEIKRIKRDKKEERDKYEEIYN